jgi:hypothetical protein
VRIKKEPKSAKPKNDRSQYIPFNKNWTLMVSIL